MQQSGNEVNGVEVGQSPVLSSSDTTTLPPATPPTYVAEKDSVDLETNGDSRRSSERRSSLWDKLSQLWRSDSKTSTSTSGLDANGLSIQDASATDIDLERNNSGTTLKAKLTVRTCITTHPEFLPGC